MDKGIFLIAFGKQGYYLAAVNLAISIKHFNPEVKVALCADRGLHNYLFPHEKRYFDQIIELKEEDFKTGGKIDPAKAKTSIYSYLPFKENLYLDVDAVCVKDIMPLLDYFSNKEGFYFTDVVSSGKKTDKIDYTWAKNDVLWREFNLPEDGTYRTIQSSFCFIRKCKEARKFFKRVKDNYRVDFPHKELSWRWGGTLPDEMMFSAALCQMDINPDCGLSPRPIFFGHKMSKDRSKIVNDHYLLALYGNGGARHNALVKLEYREFADALMDKYVRAINKTVTNGKYQRWIKVPSIMADKHANN